MLMPATTEKLNGGYFCKWKPTLPSEQLTYISYFSHTIVGKFEIELLGWKKTMEPRINRLGQVT